MERNSFNEIVEILFTTQNNEFNNIFEKDKISRFKKLCETKKLVFLGTGYYLKSMPKYLKLTYGVELYGVYDWKEELENKNSPFSLLSDINFVENEKYNKYKDKFKLLTKEEFYKNPDDYVVFINLDKAVYSQHTLYNSGFRHIYTMRNLAKNLISNKILEKQSGEFDEYDVNKLNHPFSSVEIANIITLYDLLEDEKSKQVLINILKFKLTEDFFYTMKVKDDTSLQYFDPDVIKFSKEEVFIDCGGYIGDSIDSFLNIVKNQFKYIYSYEPDDKNFEKLTSYIKTCKSSEKIQALNAGVGHKEETTYLSGEGLITTCTQRETERKAKILTIENSISHIPTFIKMDVQAFEVSALLGIMESIKQHKPKLAISIYHKWDDLWTIPLLLKHWVPEYRLIIRHYECTQEETILYALPN